MIICDSCGRSNIDDEDIQECRFSGEVDIFKGHICSDCMQIIEGTYTAETHEKERERKLVIFRAMIAEGIDAAKRWEDK